jgi:hypothetical protein
MMLVADSGAMPIPTEPFEMICDKPFVFIQMPRTLVTVVVR